jgi:hypothetical protein
MRNILLAIVVAALTASSAVAQQFGSRNDDKSGSSGPLLPLKRPATGNPCAAYGPGFVRVEGTSSCVKIGGAVSVGAGSSSGGR